MLLSEIIFNIKNLIAGGIQSDDENLSNDQVAFIINYYRAKLIRQDASKGRAKMELHIQNLGHVALQQADKNECCGIEDCILRTKLQVPKPLETHGTLNITFVGTTAGKEFTKKSHNTMSWSKAAKYTGCEPFWYYQNGYLYLTNPPTAMLSTINIQGIFEDPKKAQEFRTCDCDNGESCDDSYDFEYPMSLHNVDLLVKMIAETELRILTALGTDTTNDGLDQPQP
jgi:hypothetical protein